jgi:acetate kinase
MNIAVLNAGSSTYKCALYEFSAKGILNKTPLWEDSLDFGTKKAPPSTDDLKKLFSQCPHLQPSKIAAVGHRIVHGGNAFSHPCIITNRVKQTLYSLIPLAPLHTSANLQGIEAMESLFPHALSIAVFDTAFHKTISQAAYTYALPESWRQYGIRRYGFHGISHEYCVNRAAEILGRDLNELKIVSCHLGNGSSLAAISKGHSIDTTMGFTPLEGVIMGTRAGSIDPGILIYLMQEHQKGANELNDGLNDESGLKGIAGTSDMRTIIKKINEGNADARLAFEMYVHSLHKNIGAMIGSLGGIDVLLFTGGIGENSAEIRQHVCNKFNFLNLSIDSIKNTLVTVDSDVAETGSTVRVLVIHTREDLAIAQACTKFLHN